MAVDIIARGMAASAAHGGGGGALPPVSQADDGKVLSVVSGNWDKTEVPRGYSMTMDGGEVFDEGSIDISTPQSTYYVGSLHESMDYEAIQNDPYCIVYISGSSGYRMPIFTDYANDYMVIGDWDADSSQPTFKNCDYLIRVDGISGTNTTLSIACIYPVSNAHIVIEKEPLTIAADEDFVTATQLASRLEVVCPPQIVSTAQYNGLLYAQNGKINETNILEYMPTAKSQIYIYIEGGRATYNPSENRWHLHTDSYDYYIRMYTIGSSPTFTYFQLSAYDSGGWVITGNYTASVWFQNDNAPDMLNIHMTGYGGSVQSNIDYSEIVACVNNEVPIIADFNGLACSVIPTRAALGVVHDGDTLTFSAIEILPLIGSDDATLRVYTINCSSPGQWYASYVEYDLQGREPPIS